MSRAFRRLVVLALVALPTAAGLAFEWSAEIVRSGDQRYLIEVVQGDGDDARTHRVEIVLVDRGGAFDVGVTVTVARAGVAPAEVGRSPFDASTELMAAMSASAANAVFASYAGIAGEVVVRDEPVALVGGIGRVHYEREEQVAGLTCVVVRVELAGYGEYLLAVAEGVPFPCFSAYGEGPNLVRTRILEADGQR